MLVPRPLLLRQRLAAAGVITATAIAVPAVALAAGPGSPSGKPAPPPASGVSASKSAAAAQGTGTKGLKQAEPGAKQAEPGAKQAEPGAKQAEPGLPPAPVIAFAARLRVSTGAAERAFKQVAALSDKNGVDPANPALAAIARGLGVRPAQLAAAWNAVNQSGGAA